MTRRLILASWCLGALLAQDAPDNMSKLSDEEKDKLDQYIIPQSTLTSFGLTKFTFCRNWDSSHHNSMEREFTKPYPDKHGVSEPGNPNSRRNNAMVCATKEQCLMICQKAPWCAVVVFNYLIMTNHADQGWAALSCCDPEPSGKNSFVYMKRFESGKKRYSMQCVRELAELPNAPRGFHVELKQYCKNFAFGDNFDEVNREPIPTKREGKYFVRGANAVKVFKTAMDCLKYCNGDDKCPGCQYNWTVDSNLGVSLPFSAPMTCERKPSATLSLIYVKDPEGWEKDCPWEGGCKVPSMSPTGKPTGSPTPKPTTDPTPQPTNDPTPTPTDNPTPQDNTQMWPKGENEHLQPPHPHGATHHHHGEGMHQHRA